MGRLICGMNVSLDGYVADRDGGGTPFFPALDTPIRLRQIESQRFASGVVYLGFVPR